ncbi:hypothetical protein ACWF94_39125, partial [Streptomyces sp. NPDC055078]
MSTSHGPAHRGRVHDRTHRRGVHDRIARSPGKEGVGCTIQALPERADRSLLDTVGHHELPAVEHATTRLPAVESATTRCERRRARREIPAPAPAATASGPPRASSSRPV